MQGQLLQHINYAYPKQNVHKSFEVKLQKQCTLSASIKLRKKKKIFYNAINSQAGKMINKWKLTLQSGIQIVMNSKLEQFYPFLRS